MHERRHCLPTGPTLQPHACSHPCVPITRWLTASRKLLATRQAQQRELWYLDELSRRLDDAAARCERQRSGAGVVTGKLQRELQRLLDLGIEAGTVQRLDADLSRPGRAAGTPLAPRPTPPPPAHPPDPP